MISVRRPIATACMAVLVASCGGTDQADTRAATDQVDATSPTAAVTAQKAPAISPEEGAKRFQTISSARVSMNGRGTPTMSFWDEGGDAECTIDGKNATVRNLRSNQGSTLTVSEADGKAEASVTAPSGAKIWELVERDPVSGVSAPSIIIFGTWTVEGKQWKGKMVVTCR